MFKASDYRIRPFELESVLIEHEAVAEAAVVPSPDPLRLAVPKAYVVLAAGLRARRRHRAGRSSRSARDAARAVQADPAHRVRRAAEDHLRQDPPGRAAHRRARPGGRRRPPEPERVLGRQTCRRPCNGQLAAADRPPPARLSRGGLRCAGGGALRPGIADPQGATIERSLPTLGFDGVQQRAGRQGHPLRPRRAPTRRPPAPRSSSSAARFLTNPVIEDAVVIAGAERRLIGVVLFPGTNCEQDVIEAIRHLGGAAEIVWHGDRRLPARVDAVVAARAASPTATTCAPVAIARFSPVMDAVTDFARWRRPGDRASATASRSCARRACCPAP